MTLRLRGRQRLRRKQVIELNEKLEKALGVRPFKEDDALDFSKGPEHGVLLLGGKAICIIVDEDPILTVRGILAYRPSKRYVTVDMGAVPYVCNGADVMAPGIVDADSWIAAGHLVWVRDERNLQPLAVGRALMSGREMKDATRGKAVCSIHYVGDDLWKLGEEQ